MTTPTLPALDLTADGRVIDADTGAIVAIDDPAALPATITDALDNYARAKVEADALAMRTRGLRENMIHDMVDALLADDPGYREDVAALQAARQVITETEAALDGYFSDRTDKVSLDTGRVLVTWGKPRETWSLAKAPSWYATNDAFHSLASYLDANDVCDTESAGLVAQAALAWLNPTAKVGDAPAVKLTVRGEGGGR